MKDVPNHMKKLNRQVVRSERRSKDQEETFADEFRRPESEKQKKKKAKLERKKEHEEHISMPLTPDEQNKKMNERVPLRKEESHLPPKN
jgi:hypothetical protein